jgi:hypothetical protein
MGIGLFPIISQAQGAPEANLPKVVSLNCPVAKVGEPDSKIVLNITIDRETNQFKDHTMRVEGALQSFPGFYKALTVVEVKGFAGETIEYLINRSTLSIVIDANRAQQNYSVYKGTCRIQTAQNRI